MSTAITTIQVAASADDAECNGATWPGGTTATTNLTAIRFGYYSTLSLYYMCGFRFTGVPLDKGVTINSATLSLMSNVTLSASLVTTVAAEAVDNAAAFNTSTHTPYTAYGARTSAVVDWTMPTMTAGAWWTSPNLASIIQEIIDRSGWANGQALKLIIYAKDSSQANSRQVRTYDTAGNISGAKLDITYTEASGDIEATANLAAATADGLQATAELILDPSLYYAYQDALLTDAEGATVEADLQVTSSDTGQDHGGMIEACTGGAQYVLWIGQDGFNLHGQPRVLQDMTDRVHRFRLEARGGVCRVKVDDQLRQYGTAANATARQEAAAGSYPGAP